MAERKEYKFRSFPVINSDGRLVGVVTGRDFEFCDQPNKEISEIMNNKLFTGSLDTTPLEAERIMRAEQVKILPIVGPDNTLAGLYLWSDVIRLTKQSSRCSSIDGDGRLLVGAAIGTGKKEIARANVLIDKEVDVLVIDTAHGDSKPVYETLIEVKRHWPNTDVVVGNITEGDSARRLVEKGADGIKVGQGPGSICTTRIIAGIGCPQATAIHNCTKALRDTDVPVCADGGIKNSGDITIALAIGAKTVMIGRMIAGTNEAPGDITIIDGVPCKHYRGMGSLSAMKENSSSRQRYRQKDSGKLIPEGIEGVAPVQGPVSERLNLCIGGLRAGLGYVGAGSLPELRQKAHFYHLSSASQSESHPHDVHIIAEAPNYTAE
ncbi:MAG TPA: CBS domain-containing protein [Candidatus Atribacteria bacterium]|nr:CBS domain-containing protein [Candidatus Atribacteria bacterium]